jgi:hypothetical protein
MKGYASHHVGCRKISCMQASYEVAIAAAGKVMLDPESKLEFQLHPNIAPWRHVEKVYI